MIRAPPTTSGIGSTIRRWRSTSAASAARSTVPGAYERTGSFSGGAAWLIEPQSSHAFRARSRVGIGASSGVSLERLVGDGVRVVDAAEILAPALHCGDDA